jgi:hypothetical protein
MSTALDDPITDPAESPAQRLRTTMAAVRVSLSWLGIRKSLNSDQKARAADTFGAEGKPDVSPPGKVSSPACPAAPPSPPPCDWPITAVAAPSSPYFPTGAIAI